MKITKYTKLGLLVVFTFIILIWGLNYLKGIDFFRKNTNYSVIYNRVDGLLESSAVTINGFKVGQVSNIEFLSDHSGRLIVNFSLNGDFFLPQGTIARIVSSDLMGTKAIHLEINKSDKYYSRNDTIPGDIESDLKEQVSMQVLPLKNKAEELLSSLDSAITVVTYVFNKQTRKNLSESFEHINRAIANIETVSGTVKRLINKNEEHINSIISNADTLSSIIKGNSNDFNQIVENLKNISDSLSHIDIGNIADGISQTINGLNNVLSNLQSKDSSAGLFLNDAELYRNLNELSRSLDLLLNDVRRNPKRYVHFSAFDLGKNIYITSPSETDTTDNYIHFKVHLISSSSPIAENNLLFSDLGKIEEVYKNGVFSYFAGNSTEFKEIKKLHDQAVINFPEASIIAIKNGKRIKLGKAIKKQQ